jgi:hypothetical protein
MLTIDFSKHLPHALNIVQIQEPGLRITLVFFEWHGESTVIPRGVQVSLCQDTSEYV